MKRIAAAALVLLAACSSEPEGGNAGVPANVPAPKPAPSPTSAPITDSHRTPHPTRTRTFSDWTVACDNGGQCSMTSLSPEDGAFYPVDLALTRDAGPNGAISVVLVANREGLSPARVAVDGVSVGELFQTTSRGMATVGGNAAAAIAYALADGHALSVRDAGGGVLATLSLDGAAAALRFIDAAQGRADTATAIVAKGNEPASAVPAAPALPVIVATPVARGAAQIDATMAAELKKRARCDAPLVADLAPEAYLLGDGATLVLVPCNRGAYNLSSALFVVEDGKATPARIDAPSGFTEIGATVTVPEVVNGSVENGVLTSYARGRGLGDCGVQQDFVWDGTMLRLAQQAEMSECRGNPNLLTTWRTRVVRR